MTHALRFAVAALLCSFAVWWYLRSRDDARTPTVADAPPPSAATIPAGPPRYRPLAPAARAALLAQLDPAHPGAAAPAAPTPAPLAGQVDATAPADSVAAVAPALQACYQQTRASRSTDRVQVDLTARLVGGAAGTVIVDAALTGDAPFTADLELGPCLQAALLAIELPPMINGTAATAAVRLTLADR
ncbi:MAG: hypothetical protein R3B06_10490 [Kofleriaceae bacterium]